MNPENTFFSVKRFIGRKMEEVKDESKQVPYQVSPSSSSATGETAEAVGEQLHRVRSGPSRQHSRAGVGRAVRRRARL